MPLPRHSGKLRLFPQGFCNKHTVLLEFNTMLKRAMKKGKRQAESSRSARRLNMYVY